MKQMLATGATSFLGCAFVMILGLLSVHDAAQAGAGPRPSVVSLHQEGAQLVGEVGTSDTACLRNRVVEVWKQAGDRGGADDLLVSRVKASVGDERALVRVSTLGMSGRLYAEVRPRGDCAGAASVTVRVTHG